MTRPWRIEFEGAYYHILSRGNERRNIFHDNDDRISFLEILGKMSERFEVEVYAYGKKSPEWLRTAPILSHFDGKDKNKAYREMVQRYSREEKRIWEDFRHGLFLGSQKFIDRIKSGYLSEKPDGEIPQKRHVFRDTNPKTILEKAAKVLKCNTNDFLESARISDSNKLNRDLLIYLLWSGVPVGIITRKSVICLALVILP